MAYDPFGDETIFLEPLPDKLQCPVCLRNVQKNPHLTRCCGNHFCQTCIESVQERGHACPLCKSNRIEIFPNLQQKRDINQLRVRCPLHKENHGECEWKGNFGGLREHVIGHHAEIVLEEEQRREAYVGEQSCYWPPPSTSYHPLRDGGHLVVLPRDGGSVVVSPTRMSGYMYDSGFHVITTPGQRPHVLLHHRNSTRHQYERSASHHGGHPPLLQQPLYNPLSEHSYHISLRDDYPGSAGGSGASDTSRGEPSQGSSTSSSLRMLVPPHHSASHPDDLRCYFGPGARPTSHRHPSLGCPHFSQRHPPPDPYHLPPPHDHGLGRHHSAPRDPHWPGHCRHGHQHPHPPHHHHHHPGPR